MTPKDYVKVINHISKTWPKLTFALKKENLRPEGFSQKPLPNKFISANAKRFRYDQFYWDTYFIIMGLVVIGKLTLAKGMVENLVHLFKKHGRIPISNRDYQTAVSQPPFLTSMAEEVFLLDGDPKWLEEITEIAEKELRNYWQNAKHLTTTGLSRYSGYYMGHLEAEYESGWDKTSRFYKRCADFAAVDLNSLLYKYEIDLARNYERLGKEKKAKEYLELAETRSKKINKYLWNEEKGFFFDYDFINKKQSPFYSLAGFYPLWAGIATEKQAQAVKNNLKKFEQKWGLANTQPISKKTFGQWDYPNGWANQHLIVIQGLLNYGYEKDATRIAKKWLDLNTKVYQDTRKLWERYNVVTGGLGRDGDYQIQHGFAWTNAVFLRLLKIFS